LGEAFRNDLHAVWVVSYDPARKWLQHALGLHRSRTVAPRWRNMRRRGGSGRLPWPFHSPFQE